MLGEDYESGSITRRFENFLEALLQGTLVRNSFEPWEAKLLMDIDGCVMQRSIKRRRLVRYERAVIRHLEKGGAEPFLFSEYLQKQSSAA
jgi:hypothetical protein